MREEKQEQAAAFGFDYEELLVVDPEHFTDGADGPCNSAEFRKRFWTDVLQSLELSYMLLFEKAREVNHKTREIFPEEYIDDLEERILRIQTDSVE